MLHKLQAIIKVNKGHTKLLLCDFFFIACDVLFMFLHDLVQFQSIKQMFGFHKLVFFEKLQMGCYFYN